MRNLNRDIIILFLTIVLIYLTGKALPLLGFKEGVYFVLLSRLVLFYFLIRLIVQHRYESKRYLLILALVFLGTIGSVFAFFNFKYFQGFTFISFFSDFILAAFLIVDIVKNRIKGRSAKSIFLFISSLFILHLIFTILYTTSKEEILLTSTYIVNFAIIALVFLAFFSKKIYTEYTIQVNTLVVFSILLSIGVINFIL